MAVVVVHDHWVDWHWSIEGCRLQLIVLAVVAV